MLGSPAGLPCPRPACSLGPDGALAVGAAAEAFLAELLRRAAARAEETCEHAGGRLDGETGDQGDRAADGKSHGASLAAHDRRTAASLHEPSSERAGASLHEPSGKPVGGFLRDSSGKSTGGPLREPRKEGGGGALAADGSAPSGPPVIASYDALAAAVSEWTPAAFLREVVPERVLASEIADRMRRFQDATGLSGDDQDAR